MTADLIESLRLANGMQESGLQANKAREVGMAGEGTCLIGLLQQLKKRQRLVEYTSTRAPLAME